MITSKEIEDWFALISVSEFDGVSAKNVYQMAEIAYRKGVEDAIRRCELRASSLPGDQAGVARQCARDVASLI